VVGVLAVDAEDGLAIGSLLGAALGEGEGGAGVASCCGDEVDHGSPVVCTPLTIAPLEPPPKLKPPLKR